MDEITERSGKLSPILKWAGDKEQELKYILPATPASIQNYYEPFVGGGAVYTAITADRYYINDRSEELISLYRNIAAGTQGSFFAITDALTREWERLTAFVNKNESFLVTTYKDYSEDRCTEDITRARYLGLLSREANTFRHMFAPIVDHNLCNFQHELEANLLRKIKRMKQLEGQKHPLPYKDVLDNLETAFKSAFYMHVRYLCNVASDIALDAATRSALFFFIRNYAYSGMFRYNASGAFNVPYGGIGYNNKKLQKKTDYLKSAPLQQRLHSTVIMNLDFEQFLQAYPPSAGDFVFLDPPYDSEFSTYANNEFSRNDQQRLASYLTERCRANWMLVIKNTDFIQSLYTDKGLNIRSFDKTYLVSFMNRNDKRTEHLVIRNY